MSAAHVKRAKAKRAPASRKRKPKQSVWAQKLGLDEASATRLARWSFGLFVAAIALIAAFALNLPGRAALAAGEAVGDAGFKVRSIEVAGTDNMDNASVYEVAVDAQSMPLPLVDVKDIRTRLLSFGWVKDARVTRRYPDSLVIDIIEREPSALWQDDDQLKLIDNEGVVLDLVPISEMPDLPLLLGEGANAHAGELRGLLRPLPTIGQQLVSAEWVSDRRWDLNMQTGETLVLPEGQKESALALAKFVKIDKKTGLLGQGYLRFDLRIPGKMVVRLPRKPGEPIIPDRDIST